MKRFLIIGAGTFGRIAVDRLQQADPQASITLVDRDAQALAPFADRSIVTVCRDGTAELIERMTDHPPPEWIVPAVPRHVAYEWMRDSLEQSRGIIPVPVPEPVFDHLPNAIRGPGGEAYMSNADFICPDDCPEPESRCPSTGKPRPRILHRYLAGLSYADYRSVVVVSRQLAPGVGGYPPEALRTALAAVAAAATPVLLSTACKCHGVMHAFRFDRLRSKTL